MKKLNIAFIGLISFMIMACNNPTANQTENQDSTNSSSEAKVERTLPPQWTQSANIYEVNIRQYSEEGTFNAFTEQLPRLKEMGVDILWLMPIHPIGELNRKGTLGSYYSIKDYKDVNPEFGTLDDFKNLVKKAHELGMYVMIDWVANHTSWDNVWVNKHPDFYERTPEGGLVSPFDWTDVAALDYNNQEMRKSMLDALVYWVKEADIDGYRCDVAGEVPTDFWVEARKQLDQMKPVFMLAEAEKPELVEYAFDMDYGWEFHHLMNQIAKGEKNAKDVLTYLEKEKANYPAEAYKMNFITNHDENSWNGTIKERLDTAANAMAVLSFTLSDMPLIYSGQEAANEKRLEFFEKDPIDWKDYPKQNFYKNLTKLKHDNPALWNGLYGGEITYLPTDQDDKLFGFKRVKGDNDIMVLINLSPENYTATFTKDDLVNYKPLLLAGFAPTMEVNSFTMYPWGYIVLQKVKVQ